MACPLVILSSSSQADLSPSRRGSPDDSEPSPTSSTSSQGSCYCGVCGKTFRRPSDLTKHQRYHEKQFMCEEVDCAASFSTQKDLNRHLSSMHAKGWGFQCRVAACSKARREHIYNRRDNFVRHMKTVHPDEDLKWAVHTWTVKRS